MKDKLLKNNKLILGLIISGIVLVLIGSTFAWFSYAKEGTKKNTIKSGSVTFHYEEVSQGITLEDAMPMTDAQGMAQTNYFDFDITSNTSPTVDIPYYITARRSGTGTNMDNVVKVYLTKVTGSGNNEVETPVQIVTGKNIAKFSELGSYINSDGINIPQEEKLLHRDLVFAGTRNYQEKYRLRMWIDIDAEFLVQEAGQPDVYPYEGKTYTLKVNVYSSGEQISQSKAELRDSANINDIQVDGNILRTTATSFLGNVEMPAGSTNVDKDIMINTENPNAQANVRKVSAQGVTLSEQEVEDVTEPVTLNLTLGDNDYNIAVTSENKRTIKQYDLKLTTAYPTYDVTMVGSNVTFSSDSLTIDYGSTNTVTVTPSPGYYISNYSCTNGYTITGLSKETSSTSQQTATINNNNKEQDSICTITTAMLASGLYDDNWNLKYTWQQLINNNYITVTNGEAIVNLNYSQRSVLTGKLVIDRSVTSLARFAFSSCSGLTAIVMPNTVTSIGGEAFYQTGLTSIEIPNSVTSIGNYAFAYTPITSVKIPASVTSIGYALFEDCKNEIDISIDPNNQVYDSRDNSNAIIETSTNKLIDGCLSTRIPNSVKIIGQQAFWKMRDLTSIEIPASVTNIESIAFAYNTGLTNLQFASTGQLTIEENAFYGCEGLKDLTIPASVVSIGENAFEYCSGLTNLTVGSASIGDSAFKNCTNLTSITIPSSVTSIGNSAFYNCTNLTSITIPSSVTSIGNSAFYGADLASIEIPSSVTSIGRYAFGECTNLTSATFANPNGWYVTTNEAATSGTSLTLTNTTQNANYLKNNSSNGGYSDKYWKRNTN